MTRPAGRVRRCSKCHGSSPVGSRSLQNITGRVGSGQEVFKSRGSGPVGTRIFQSSRFGSGPVKIYFFPISRIGSGRVNNFSNFTGRARSDQEVMKISRVGSGHDPRERGNSRVGSARPASCFLQSHSARGCDTSKAFFFLPKGFSRTKYSII